MPATESDTKSAKVSERQIRNASIAERVLPIVGANIVARREELGMSQRAMAEHAGVDRIWIRQVEQGNRAATLIILAKIAEALDTSVEALTAGV